MFSLIKNDFSSNPVILKFVHNLATNQSYSSPNQNRKYTYVSLQFYMRDTTDPPICKSIDNGLRRII